jgi:hypothetical protein
MTFLAPGWLALCAGLGAAVVALHLLARRRPRILLFPTARFIPDRPSTAASLAPRPTDLAVLALRLLLLLLLGLALARPVRSSPDRTSSIVLLDRSRLAPVLDSPAATAVRAADVVLAFDSVAQTVDPPVAAGLPLGKGRGSISAALVAALRATPELAGRGDSIALTIISPFAAEEFDAATLAIRNEWKGRITLVPQEGRPLETDSNQVALPPDDPLSGPLALLRPAGTFLIRLARGRPSSADSAWAANGGTLVVWPRVLADMTWPRGPGDSIGGVAAGGRAVVAAFPRPVLPPQGSVAAVWADGAIAATTTQVGTGCLKNVAIEIPAAGDLSLRPSFLNLVRTLLSPCAGEIDTARVSSATLDSLRGTSGLLPSVNIAGSLDRKTPANRWLLLGAVIVFAIEPIVRRRRVPQ